MQKTKKVGNRTFGECWNCGAVLLRPDGKTGLCIRCVKYAKFSGRKCENCKKNPIREYNQSGLCQDCYRLVRRSPRSQYSYQRPKEHHKTEIIVECHRPGCGNKFILESWQHPQMAWCETCRNSPDYKNYEEGVDDFFWVNK